MSYSRLKCITKAEMYIQIYRRQFLVTFTYKGITLKSDSSKVKFDNLPIRDSEQVKIFFISKSNVREQ